MSKILTAILLTFLLIFGITSFVRAQSASLYLSPSSGSFLVGSTFDVSIFVNTGGKSINAVKVDLEFNPRKLQIASPTAGKSFISVWISQPTFSNIEGRASFQGGLPSPGIDTSSGLVSTITFRATTPGETIISISDSSQILLDDGKGTNILNLMGKGMYRITIPPPEGPEVTSPTHPDQNKWYKNNDLSLGWNKEEGVTDFSYSIDHDFHRIPDDISEGDLTSVSYTDLKDGVWYFHIKAKKGGGWGGISHYLVQIDTTPPAEFDFYFEPVIKSQALTSKEPVIYFMTTDALSGICCYELKVIDLQEDTEEEGEGFFVEVTSPYKLHLLKASEYEIIVRAYDKAMNEKIVSEKVVVIPTDEPFHVSKRGINFWSFYLPWQRVALILVSLIILISIIIFGRKKYRQRKNLKGLREKVKENNETIKKKLRKE